MLNVRFLKLVNIFFFPEMKNSKVVEFQLADFLVFLRRVISSRVMKKNSTFVKWVDPLTAIISQKCTSGTISTETATML